MKSLVKKLLLLSLVAVFAACDNEPDGQPNPPYVYKSQPRYFAACDGKVFVSYYDGYIARIDTATLEVDAMVKVGRNPEQLAVCNGYLYVANSGGMDLNTALGCDNTVSVVNLSTFTEVEKIEVVCNPAVVVACGDDVYVASYGNYNDVPGMLQCISPDGTVAVVEECPNMTEFCYSAGRLYGFFSSYDADWNKTTTYLSYDVESGEVDSPWIKEPSLPVPYKVSAAGEYVCVTSSDYINDGDAYLYNTEGLLVGRISTGLNPVKVVAGAGKYYVLNSGDWKSANSSLTMYDFSAGDVMQNYFESQNGRCLGNTANDIIVYGSKMYIAVSGESTVEVVSLDAESVKQIECTVAQ